MFKLLEWLHMGGSRLSRGEAAASAHTIGGDMTSDNRTKQCRRDFLKTAGAAGVAAGAATALPTGAAAQGSGLTDLTASEAAKRIATGELKAEALAEALIARTDTCQAKLNAYISFDADKLRAAARAADKARTAGNKLGPLGGVPLALKDNIDTTSMPTSGGTPALRNNTPPADAPVWAKLMAAGALLAGKTNMHELAFGITNNNAGFGPARNAYNPKMIPGGSSGGTAAAVGARMVPAGLGTDTGGSVRIPAALNGISGLRPTLGRWPQAGIVPISWTRDTPGPMARSVADLALMDGIVTGAPTTVTAMNLKGVRIGVPGDYFWGNLDPELAKVMAEAMARLEDAGAVLVAADIPNLAKLNDSVSFPVALWEVMRALPRYLEKSAPGVTMEKLLAGVASPDVKDVLMSQTGDKAIPTNVYRAAVGPNRKALQKAFADYFAKNNLVAMVFPTTPLPARPVGQDRTVELNGKQVPTFPTFIRNTDPMSNAGLPGVSVAAGLTAAGLPVGIEFDGPAGSDRRLLSFAATAEKLIGAIPATNAC